MTMTTEPPYEPQTQIIPVASPESEIRIVDSEEWVYYAGHKIVVLGRKKSLDDVWVHPEPGYKHGRCKMIKRTGDRCKNPVRANWTVCSHHGAGRPDKPGGLSAWHMQEGRLGKHLPKRLLETFDNIVMNPEVLNMTEELALLDTRMADLLHMLEDSSIAIAWSQVNKAYRLLDRDEITEDQYEEALQLLDEARSAKNTDTVVWGEIKDIIERRRRVAHTERKRIVDAQKVMTYSEANRFVAFLMNSVMSHVTDMEARRAISEDMKKVML